MNLSCHRRLRNSSLTSSTKITLGDILLASEKTAFTYFSPSPNHCYSYRVEISKVKSTPK
jgi:hypothetical protein